MEPAARRYVGAVVRVEEVDVIVQEDEGALQDLALSARGDAHDEVLLTQQATQSLEEQRVLEGEREVDASAL